MFPAKFSAQPALLSDQKEFAGRPFPLILQASADAACVGDVADWVRAQRDELESGLEEHGAILFRGFPLRTAEDFDALVAAFNYQNFPYEESLSNAVRINLTPRVFTANEAPPEVTIHLHHEMAQTPVYPGKLFFFCEQAPERGGETPLCRSDVLLTELGERRPEFVRDCEAKGLRYTNIMPPENDFASGMGRSWQSTLRASDREEAETRLRSLGYSWEWLPDGCLRATTPVLPAVRTASGHKTFFNQLIAAFMGWKDSRNDPSKAITFGDGSPLDAEAVHVAAELAEQLTFDVPWQTGDVALVDNFLVMHGRRTFSGKRRVLASLVACDRP